MSLHNRFRKSFYISSAIGHNCKEKITLSKITIKVEWANKGYYRGYNPQETFT